MLRSVKPFSLLTDAEFISVAPGIQRRRHFRGASIVSAGSEADGVHFIVSGRVSVLVEDQSEHDYILTVLGPDDFFGEAGLFSDSPSTVTCQAEEHCITLYVPRDRLLPHIEHNAAFASYLLRRVLKRLGEAQHKIESLALMTVYERVAQTLVETAEDVKGNWLVRAGTERMARMVGASREMVSRVIRQMIDSGALRRDKRLLFVTDRTLIAEAAGTAEPSESVTRTAQCA